MQPQKSSAHAPKLGNVRHLLYNILVVHDHWLATSTVYTDFTSVANGKQSSIFPGSKTISRSIPIPQAQALTHYLFTNEKKAFDYFVSYFYLFWQQEHKALEDNASEIYTLVFGLSIFYATLSDNWRNTTRTWCAFNCSSHYLAFGIWKLRILSCVYCYGRIKCMRSWSLSTLSSFKLAVYTWPVATWYHRRTSLVTWNSRK